MDGSDLYTDAHELVPVLLFLPHSSVFKLSSFRLYFSLNNWTFYCRLISAYFSAYLYFHFILHSLASIGQFDLRGSLNWTVYRVYWCFFSMFSTRYFGPRSGVTVIPHWNLDEVNRLLNRVVAEPHKAVQITLANQQICEYRKASEERYAFFTISSTILTTENICDSLF